MVGIGGGMTFEGADDGEPDSWPPAFPGVTAFPGDDDAAAGFSHTGNGAPLVSDEEAETGELLSLPGRFPLTDRVAASFGLTAEGDAAPLAASGTTDFGLVMMHTFLLTTDV